VCEEEAEYISLVMTMKNDDRDFFFINDDIPVYVRVIIPISCLLTVFTAFVIYNRLPGTRIIMLPFTLESDIRLYTFPFGMKTIIILKHLSISLTCFIAGVITGIISRLTPLRKNINDLWWGMLSTYLIFLFTVAAILTIQLIWSEIARFEAISLLSNIIGITVVLLSMWFFLLVEALLLFIIPHIGGFIIVARPHEFQ
jgi:hypothetical protein